MPGRVITRAFLGGTVVLAFLLLTFGFTPGILFSAEPEQLLGILGEAQELFQAASNSEDPETARMLYQRSLDRFQRILEEGGVRNGKLFYNMGNTYFQIGEIGKAILFYRRAEILDPGDGNLRHNLSYVRSRRADRLPSNQVSAAARILLFWHFLLSPKAKAYGFVSLFFLACVLGAMALLRRKRTEIILLSIAGSLSLLLLGSLIADELRLRTFRDGVITTKEVVARKGDGTAYQHSFIDPLHEGTEFSLLEERKGWYRIRLTDGRTGWIPEAAGELVLWDRNPMKF